MDRIVLPPRLEPYNIEQIRKKFVVPSLTKDREPEPDVTIGTPFLFDQPREIDLDHREIPVYQDQRIEPDDHTLSADYDVKFGILRQEYGELVKIPTNDELAQMSTKKKIEVFEHLAKIIYIEISVKDNKQILTAFWLILQTILSVLGLPVGNYFEHIVKYSMNRYNHYLIECAERNYSKQKGVAVTFSPEVKIIFFSLVQLVIITLINYMIRDNVTSQAAADKILGLAEHFMRGNSSQANSVLEKIKDATVNNDDPVLPQPSAENPLGEWGTMLNNIPKFVNAMSQGGGGMPNMLSSLLSMFGGNNRQDPPPPAGGASSVPRAKPTTFGQKKMPEVKRPGTQ